MSTNNRHNPNETAATPGDAAVEPRRPITWRQFFGWVSIYVIFVVIPLIAIAMGSQTYLDTIYRDQITELVQHQQRRLVSLRRKVGGQRSLSHMLSVFSDQLRREIDNSRWVQDRVRKLAEDLPPGSQLLIWNDSGHTVDLGGAIPQEEWTKTLAVLIRAWQASASVTLLDDPDAQRSFIESHKAQIDTVSKDLGTDFPLTRFLNQPGVLLSQHTSTQRNLLTWVKVVRDQIVIGGMLAVIPSRDMSETLGLKSILLGETNMSSEFVLGFADLEASHTSYISFKDLKPLADDLVAEYARTRTSPVSRNDWMLGAIPLSDFSSVRLFCMSKTLARRQEYEQMQQTMQLVLAALLTVGLFVCVSMARRQARSGILIRTRVVGLFVLATFLPLALLAVSALHLTQDRTRVLTQNHHMELLDGIHQLDEGFPESIRNQQVMLRGLYRKFRNKLDTPSAWEELASSPIGLGRIDALYVVDIQGHCFFERTRSGSHVTDLRAMLERLGRVALRQEMPELDPDRKTRKSGASDDSFLVATLLGKQGNLQRLSTSDAATDGYLYYDLFGRGLATTPVALIAFSRKDHLEKLYLQEAIVARGRGAAQYQLFAIDRENPTETLPTLPVTFKAALLPMVSLAHAMDSLPPERISNGEQSHLVSMVRGKYLENYFLGAFIPWQTMFHSIQTIYMVVIALLVFTLAAVVTLAVALSRSVINPITEIVDGTKRVAGGDLNHQLPVTERDEIGHLAEAFNDMSKRLKNRLYEMTTLYQISQTASISANPREVFDMTAGYLTAHLGASRAGVAWVREEEGKDANIYLPDEQKEEAIAHLTALIERGFAEKEIVIAPPEGLYPHTLIMPMCYEDHNFGAIYWTFPNNWPGITADETSFIDTLRHQLSMYIEKSRLFEQAISDGLTRLYVRRFFLVNLEKEIARSCRYSVEMSLLMMDIDHFKKFNDNYGHQAGDMVLRETAQRIMDSVRNVDIPGRYGGEELALILPQTPLSQAVLVAERIRNSIASTDYPYEQHRLKVTVSIGVTSLVGRSKVTLEAFIAEADAALYEAKHGGRNRVIVAQIAQRLAAGESLEAATAAIAATPPATNQAPAEGEKKPS